MQTICLTKNLDNNSNETLDTYILNDETYKISKEALFIGFKHRIKVEYLKSFIV